MHALISADWPLFVFTWNYLNYFIENGNAMKSMENINDTFNTLNEWLISVKKHCFFQLINYLSKFCLQNEFLSLILYLLLYHNFYVNWKHIEI